MPTRVAFLGPKGTFAEDAALALAKLEKLDAPVFLPCKGLRSVVDLLAKKLCEAAVVPIENSVEGGVTSTLDSLWREPQLSIRRALVLPIQHALISCGSMESISEVLSHPQALAQCSEWLNSNLPDALQLTTNSTAEAIKMIEGSTFRAAIGRKPASSIEQTSLKELKYPINDVAGNQTRFILLDNKKPNQLGDIASIAFSLKSNTPGALLKALSCISNLGLNMSRIESRPSKRELGEYVFFIDLDIGDNTKEILTGLQKDLEVFCEHIVNFGSYPSSTKEK